MNEKAINKMVGEIINLWQMFGQNFSFPKAFYDLTEIEQKEVVQRMRQQIKKHPPWRETK